jgi:hypothetical protein
MKKLTTLIAFLSFFTIVLTSCKKDTIVQNVLPRTILADIAVNSWKTDDGGLTYFADISVPENDVAFNQSGGVIVSLSFDNNRKIFDGLPNVVNGFSYNFTSEPDYVRIYVEDVNRQAINPPNTVIRAKIVLVDSEIID